MPGLWPTSSTSSTSSGVSLSRAISSPRRGVVEPLLVDGPGAVRELVDGELPGLAGAGGGGAEGQVEGMPVVGQPAAGDGCVLAAPVGERPLVVGDVGPVGLGVPEQDDPCGGSATLMTLSFPEIRRQARAAGRIAARRAWVTAGAAGVRGSPFADRVQQPSDGLRGRGLGGSPGPRPGRAARRRRARAGRAPTTAGASACRRRPPGGRIGCAGHAWEQPAGTRDASVGSAVVPERCPALHLDATERRSPVPSGGPPT